jgi:hypothetical protein
MKRFENLGKTMSKEDQRKVTGGVINDLYCKTTINDPFVYIASYSSHAACQTGLYSVCTGTGIPYHSCYCTSHIPVICEL